MIHYFLLPVRKGEGYSIFNPVDNHEYEVNYPADRILESCDGFHTPSDITLMFSKEFKQSPRESRTSVTSFLDSMARRGMVTWRSGV